jgi:Rrf2 family iron-sulfur cluster assembly transcriptional regulator
MMLDVARHAESGKPVSLAAISERIAVSRGYLEQLAISLRNARLIRSISGRHGGYQLALPASQILVGDIIEATIGPICIVECVDDPECCIRSSDCECRLLYALINDRIAEVLRAYTVSDLLDPEWARAVREQLMDLPMPAAHRSEADAAHPLPEGRNHGAD